MLGCAPEEVELYPGGTVRPEPRVQGQDPAPVEEEQCAAAVPPGLLGALPPMGWNGFNTFSCSPELDEAKVLATADAMVASGMQASGYHYVNLDECWQTGRAPDGSILLDANKLPSGMHALGSTLRSRGFKLGGYRRDCPDAPASLYAQDAATYRDWGIELLKIVSCASTTVESGAEFAALAAALHSVNPSLVLSLTAGPYREWMPALAQTSRTSGNITASWTDILRALDATIELAPYARPGAYNDPDMLEVGVGSVSESEARAHFSLWAILAAPLLAGNDLTSMSDVTRDILTREEIIAFNQDPLGLQAALVRDEGALQVFAKPLASCGARAVVLLNRGDTTIQTTLSWPEIWLEPGVAEVRELWSRTDLGALTEPLTLSVPPRDVVALRVTGTEPPLPRGEVWLGDAPWTYESNGYGPAERNMANGERAPGDGQPLRMRGRVYQKGLGVHPPSLLRFRLGGVCSRFTAEVGIDDEKGSGGSAVFQVWSDGEKIFDSGVMTSATPPRPVDLSVAGRLDLRLFVGTADDGFINDHADWAEARLICDP